MKYGFIGCGNMGGAIARALANTTNDIMITDRSGNGLRKNRHLCRITENTFGMKLKLTQQPEEAALGAAMYAQRIKEDEQ